MKQHVATPAAVTSIGTTSRHELLAPEGDGAVSPSPRDDIELHTIDHGRLIHSTS